MLLVACPTFKILLLWMCSFKLRVALLPFCKCAPRDASGIRRRHHVAEDRDHAGAVTGRGGADAAQQAGEEVSDRWLMPAFAIASKPSTPPLRQSPACSSRPHQTASSIAPGATIPKLFFGSSECVPKQFEINMAQYRFLLRCDLVHVLSSPAEISGHHTQRNLEITNDRDCPSPFPHIGDRT